MRRFCKPGNFLFSGSLSQLIAEERILSTIDYGRIGNIIESADTDAQLHSLLGTIQVDIKQGKKLRFVRVNNNAEVDALCLLTYWHSGNPPVHSRLINVVSDLVFLDRTHIRVRTPTHASPVS